MKKIVSLFLILLMLSGTVLTIYADADIDVVLSDIASYLYQTVKDPRVGSVGGEWAVLGLSRSELPFPEEYYEHYYRNVEEYVKEREGNLHDKKYTEYSRVILALTAIGKDPQNVGGHNLLTPLGDYEKTIWQGINGPIWALIALDSGNYDMPNNPNAKVQATREMYVNRILECQLSDGGWSLLGKTTSAQAGDYISDPDVTGMALQALSEYRDDERVQKAIETALETMSRMQDEKGGFSSWGTKNSESCVQMLVALCELNIPVNDLRFVKNGYSALDNLMTYYQSGNGFLHTDSGHGSNLMATEQAFYGIVAVKRAMDGINSLYDMSDARSFADSVGGTVGLRDKHPDILPTDISIPGKTFLDIQNQPEQTAIEALAQRGIINGKTENCFEPKSTMTRAEFAAVVVRGLDLTEKGCATFNDVRADDWFYHDVNAAYGYEIIKGKSETEFCPHGTITRAEAAVMIARAAKLCGMDTELTTFAVRDILAQFSDYVKAADWARSSLAFCYHKGIMDDSVMEISPKEAVTRAEISSMLYQMLLKAKLL